MDAHTAVHTNLCLHQFIPFKVNMYIFRGSNTIILNFVSLYKGGQLVRE